jgi:hypothetical protein
VTSEITKPNAQITKTPNRWGQVRRAVVLRSALQDAQMNAFARQTAKEDDLLRAIKHTSAGSGHKHAMLGVSIGHSQQLVVVKLSDDTRLKKAVARMSLDDEKRPAYFALPLIHPFSQAVFYWQMTLCFMIIFNMLFVPYEIVYKECARSESTAILEDASDAVFIVDIIVQLHMMIVIEERHKDRTLLIDDRGIIITEYLRFQFWADVVSTGPPFSHHYLGNKDSFSFVSVLKCVKLFRIVKVFKILAQLIHVTDEKVQIFNVCKMLLLIMYSSHLVGCFFSAVGRISGEPNWIEAAGFSFECNVAADASWLPKDEYIAGYYWAVMTLTTVGYGDISAQNNYERLFSSFVMIVGAIFYALVLGSVTSAIQELSAGDPELKQRMKTVSKFINRYNLSDDMAKRLKQSTRLQGEWNDGLFQALFETCHPEFKAELLMSIHRPMLIKTAFFRGVDEAFLKLIVDQLRMHVCLENDCVYREGDDGERMFLLNQGFVGMYSSSVDARVSLLEPGDVFGEGAVLSRTLSRRLETAVAEVRSVIHSLARDSIHSAAVAFPDVQKLMESRVVDLKVQRSELERKVAKKAKWESRRNKELGLEDKKLDSITLDISQGSGLSTGVAHILNANIFARCFCLVRCSKCAEREQRVKSRTGLLTEDTVRVLRSGQFFGQVASVADDGGRTGHVLVTFQIGDVTRQAIYEGFELERLGTTKWKVGDRVKVAKSGSQIDKTAVVQEVNWNGTGRILVAMDGSDSTTKSYTPEDLTVNDQPTLGEEEKTKRSRSPAAIQKAMEKARVPLKRDKSLGSNHFVKLKQELKTGLGKQVHPEAAQEGTTGKRNTRMTLLNDFGVDSCADCVIEKATTAARAQTFEPKWDESFQFSVPSDAEATIYVGVYQKGIVPTVLGFVEVEDSAMEQHSKVDWLTMSKLSKLGKGGSTRRLSAAVNRAVLANKAFKNVASGRKVKDSTARSEKPNSCEAAQQVDRVPMPTCQLQMRVERSRNAVEEEEPSLMLKSAHATSGRKQSTTGRKQSITGRARESITGRKQSITGRKQSITGRKQSTSGRKHSIQERKSSFTSSVRKMAPSLARSLTKGRGQMKGPRNVRQSLQMAEESMGRGSDSNNPTNAIGNQTPESQGSQPLSLALGDSDFLSQARRRSSGFAGQVPSSSGLMRQVSLPMPMLIEEASTPRGGLDTFPITSPLVLPKDAQCIGPSEQPTQRHLLLERHVLSIGTVVDAVEKQLKKGEKDTVIANSALYKRLSSVEQSIARLDLAIAEQKQSVNGKLDAMMHLLTQQSGGDDKVVVQEVGTPDAPPRRGL